MDSISIYYYTGDLSADFLWAALIWAGIGVVFWKLIHYSRREQNGLRHKKEFDLEYFFHDNVVPLAGNFLFTLVFIRFTKDIVTYANIEFLHLGEDPMFVYILFGFSQQLIIDYIKKKIRPKNEDGDSNSSNI